jgi:hypothetical protein
MIAQMGKITQESVRAYLNLSVVSSYYEILLLLPTDVHKALSLATNACSRVTPEEVTSGLAEAAMNAFRLANKMYADFVYIDRQLAEKVFAQYQDACIDLAEFFTRSRHATDIGLHCDLLTLSRTIRINGDVRALVSRPAIAIPPVINITAGPFIEAPTSSPTPVEVVAPTPTQVLPQPPVVAPTPSPAKLAAPQPVKPAPGNHRGDGIGDLGKDPLALTELDSKGVPKELPKPRTPVQKQALNFHDKSQDDRTEILSPEEWRQYFQKLWPNA